MCDGAGQPASVTDALVMLDRALGCLAAADAASLPGPVQAEALRALERARSKHTAALARVLTAFAIQAGYEDDGHGSARTWLKWQARVTTGAAAGAIGWMRRLAAHPVIGEALAAGELSESWARQICEWTDKLPEASRGDADEILAAAARAGVDLAGLAGLAREMVERSYRERDGAGADDGFADRYLQLGITFGGAGRLAGDLTPGCSAALSAVLEALGKPAGPEDVRTAAQRRHDALEDACRRLVRAGMVPARAGQPTQVMVHMTLAELRDAPGASAAEAAWAAARASQPGWLTGPEAQAAACDATVVPVVTGHLDWAALDQLTSLYLTLHDTAPAATGSGPGDHRTGLAAPRDLGPGSAADHGTGMPAREPPPDSAAPGASPGTGPAGNGPGPARHTGARTGLAGNGPHPAAPGPAGSGTSHGDHGTGPAGGDTSPARAGSSGGTDTRPGPAGSTTPPPGARRAGSGTSPRGHDSGMAGCGCACGGCHRLPGRDLSPASRARLRRALLALAADALSGPGGLAARLRSGPDAPVRSVSLPLDIGAATETIPAHLRRAVTTRHAHCAFPGCDQPASMCDIHHIIPRSRGGPTSLHNLVPLCGFHHLTAVHRWGWALRLNGDGTTTATSPDRTRTLHSHGPPSRAA